MTDQLVAPVREKPDTRAPRRVLFVCTGNTCRSPMAAALLNDMAKKEEPPRFLALSAGLYAKEGATMTERAVLALREMGVEPPAHQARNVTAELAKEADMIVGLTAAHAMELTMRYPELASRIMTLPMDIADPYGGDAETYLHCAEQLRFCITLAFFGGAA